MPSLGVRSNRPGQNASVSSPAPEKEPPQASASNQDLHDQISKRAYELYCERGYRDGEAESDWLDAEQEVRSSQRAQTL